MTLVRKNLQSTKTTTEMTAPTQPLPSGTQTNKVVLQEIKVPQSSKKIATNQTGHFPIKSSRGNQYIMVAYVHDANTILAVPLKN